MEKPVVSVYCSSISKLDDNVVSWQISLKLTMTNQPEIMVMRIFTSVIDPDLDLIKQNIV